MMAPPSPRSFVVDGFSFGVVALGPAGGGLQLAVGELHGYYSRFSIHKYGGSLGPPSHQWNDKWTVRR